MSAIEWCEFFIEIFQFSCSNVVVTHARDVVGEGALRAVHDGP